MALTQTETTSFKLYLLDLVTADYKIALYTSAATLGATTTAYTTSGEVVGTGYTAGGATLTLIAPTSAGTVAYLDFSNPTWTTATITARGALIYLDAVGDPSVAVLDFGEDRSVTGATFEIQMPSASSTSAIIRLA
jgi:O-acetylhomoserine/O-acetylserine sulfhydrylase-like pyridoxal-dependent enzyme